MLTDAANIIFGAAERRCYTISSTSKRVVPRVIDLVDDEDAWDALNEAEGRVGGKGKEKDHKPTWVPDGMDPVLEELPKWNLLSEVILEIEEEIIRQQTITRKPPALGLSPSFVVHRPLTLTLNRLKHHSHNGLIHQNMQPPNRVPLHHEPRCAQWHKRPENDDAKAPGLSLVEIPAFG